MTIESDIQPQVQQTTSHRGRILLFFAGLVGTLIVVWISGIVWTRSTIHDDPSITPSIMNSLSSRITMMTYGEMLNFLVVKSKVIIVPGKAWDGKPAEVFKLEQYTLFGIRRYTYDLDCWKARPGIDVEKMGLGITNGIAFPDEVR